MTRVNHVWGGLYLCCKGESPRDSCSWARGGKPALLKGAVLASLDSSIRLQGMYRDPVSLSSSALLTDCVSGAASVSLFCYGLKLCSTNKITKPGSIRLFLLFPGPTLNLQSVAIWMGLGGKRGRQSPRHTEGQIIRQSVSFLHCSWRSRPCQRYFEINGTII